MSGKKKALVCDDTPIMRTGVVALLSANGFDVTAVCDGAEGWKALSSGQFDIVFSDVEMPNMNGFELLNKVRKESNCKTIPFVLCTTLNNQAHIENGRKLGATSYIVKPMKKDTLDRALKNAGLL